MTLSCTNKWPKRMYGPGIYVNEVTIADVQDISGMTLPFMQQPADLGIKLTLDIGRDFQPEFVIAGNFKRDPNSAEVVGWGGAFVVQEALARLGYTGELDTANHIPTSVIVGLVGKHFLRLSYVSGTKKNGLPRYSDWNHVATVEEGAEDLVGRFRRSLAKGYPRNYRPELLGVVPDATASPAPVEEDAF